jgi:hypothetical protein
VRLPTVYGLEGILMGALRSRAKRRAAEVSCLLQVRWPDVSRADSALLSRVSSLDLVISSG